jgi:hypothetical protein
LQLWKAKPWNISKFDFCSSYFSIDLSMLQVLMYCPLEFYYPITTLETGKFTIVNGYTDEEMRNTILLLLTFSVQMVLFTLLITYCYQSYKVRH